MNKKNLIKYIVILLIVDILTILAAKLIGYDPTYFIRDWQSILIWFVILFFPSIIIYFLFRDFSKNKSETDSPRTLIMVGLTLLLFKFLLDIVVSVLDYEFIIQSQIEKLDKTEPNFITTRQYFENLYSYKKIIASSILNFCWNAFLMTIIYFVGFRKMFK